MMWDIAAGGKPTWWQKVTDRPNEYPAHWADGEGDVYSPPEHVRAAMVLVPGAAVLGRDEPRLQALARTFARAGFVVLVPELPEVRRLALSRHDADRVASAMRQLRQWQPGQPLGVAAVSYAVAPAVIAALQDRAAVHRRHRRLPRCGGGDPLRHHRRVPADRRSARAPARAQRLRPLGLPARQCRPARRSERHGRAADHRHDALPRSRRRCRRRSPPGSGRTARRCWRWSRTAIPTR